ncbi:MAG: hypothetical protein LBU65_09990 [Planctomycetaceae bacterium]|jgi:hypothetical protein|nr:hypothetical protein [Planctomycetaceae bacterium]
MKQPLIDANAFLHEKLEALLQEFNQVGDAAPTSQVLNDLDSFLFVNGRKFLTEFLETKMQERINNTEKLAETKQCPRCKKNEKRQQKDENGHNSEQSHSSRPHLSALRQRRLKASRSFKSVAKICGEHGEWVERTRWFEEMRLVLLQEGFASINARLKILQLDKGRFREKQRKAVWKLRKYFWKHRGRMNYRERLAQGRSIGSGQREGACKNLVGKRLKQTGVCWKVDRANRIAVITAALYSDKWKLCWNTAKYLQMFYTPWKGKVCKKFVGILAGYSIDNPTGHCRKK